MRISLRHLIATSTLALGLAIQPAAAQEKTFNQDQTDAVRKIVRDYLMEHPEVIAEAIESLREKARAQAESDAKKTLESRKDEVFFGKEDPVLGNAAGDIIVVEFFDYNCPYCRVTTDPLLESAKADGKVKVVLKELPILSDDSVAVARIALAAKKQGKYEDLHRALMKAKGKLDEKTALKLAGDVGANVDQIKKDMMGADIDKYLRSVHEQARSMDIASTPTLIVADKAGANARIIASAVDGAMLKQVYDLTRNGGRLKSQ